ncbi:MAG: hypothetical protein A3C35_04885 [Omnitrophica bacterium RIFCSPHIGHO2_02_FULL_46_11]|nr:MAG: hypothetical protein A3C35_04885 [Omnitrophica bacterium RIFCSPHIGHO2_02_FULL_46_11]OGW87773.1 MAG: hypothetical protein A3A81_01575 [Omnitrophica bacterium RIFCSPLOWO2_01_FULL_45_10b]
MKCKRREAKKKQVTIGLIQMKASPAPEPNLTKAVEMVRKAARKGAQIISLQELFKTRYFPQTRGSSYFKLSETIPSPTSEVFRRLAYELKVVIIVPIFERQGRKYYNAAIIIDADGNIVGKYRKMHLPNDPYFYEKHYFSPGDSAFNSYETKYGKIGVLICWDQWFPEAARAIAMSGAQIIFYPTAIGWNSSDPKRMRQNELNAWQIIQRAHAIANGVYVAAVNRVGREEALTFWGHSFVAGPFGEMVAQASENQEEILIAVCDLSKIEKIRKVWPFLKSLRSDVYGGLGRHCPYEAPYWGETAFQRRSKQSMTGIASSSQRDSSQ